MQRCASVKYSLHTEYVGWQDFVSDWSVAGTTGLSLRTEAVRIELVGMLGWSVKYWAHEQ
jgi:uncharacterized protein YjdB